MTAYLQALWAFGRRRLWGHLALLLIVSAFEGVGVLMLVPLLTVAGVFDAGDDLGSFGDAMARLFEWFSLPLTLPVVLTAFLGLVCAREGAARFQVAASDSLIEGFVFHLREQLYRAVTQARWLWLTRTRSSDVLQTLAGDLTRVGGGTQQLLQAVSTGIMLVVYGLLATWVSPVMAGVVALVGGAVLWLLRHRIQLVRLRGRRTTQLGRRLFAAVSEHVGALKVSKSFGAEQRSRDHFVDTIRQLRSVAHAFRMDRANAAFWFAVGSVAIFSGVVYVAVEVVRLPGAELLLLLLIYARIMPRVSSLVQGYQQVAHMVPAFESYHALRSACEAEAETSTEDPVAPLPFHDEITLRGVSFRYREAQREGVLRQIDLRIAANRTTAIVGPSGAGKTTLTDLLMGLLSPTEGEIRIDGQLLTADNLRAWRQNIGYVPQDTFLFGDTVRANLCWIRREVTEENIWHALDLAAARDFVAGLPDGLETEIGELGRTLSGGERQRLALARALLAAPRLLILDEATSHLDVENEQRIQTAIEHLHGSLTVVVIAHRLSTVRSADHIVVLEHGSVVEAGSWDALNARDGRFRRSVRAQATVGERG